MALEDMGSEEEVVVRGLIRSNVQTKQGSYLRKGTYQKGFPYNTMKKKSYMFISVLFVSHDAVTISC